MPTRTIFHNIYNEIRSELEKAKFEIYIAVAWFTDKRLFDLVYKKAKSDNIKVKILLRRDENNYKAKFDHRDIEKVKGDCYFRQHHNKFCVIDRKVVITGSSNWTYSGMNNPHKENVVIIEDQFEGEKYAKQFLKVIEQLENLQDYDTSDDYKLKFIGCLKRVINSAIQQGFKLLTPIGETIENWWKKRTSFIMLNYELNGDKADIKIVISEELRKVIEKEREEILYLPVYQIVHKSGSVWEYALVLGLEENDGQRFDALDTL